MIVEVLTALARGASVAPLRTTLRNIKGFGNCEFPNPFCFRIISTFNNYCSVTGGIFCTSSRHDSNILIIGSKAALSGNTTSVKTPDNG